MKRVLYIYILLSGGLFYSQMSNQDEIQNSSQNNFSVALGDALKKFVIENPNDPWVQELQRKLLEKMLMQQQNANPSQHSPTSTTITEAALVNTTYTETPEVTPNTQIPETLFVEESVEQIPNQKAETTTFATASESNIANQSANTQNEEMLEIAETALQNDEDRAEAINALFNGETNSRKKVYLNFVNNSECDIEIKIKGTDKMYLLPLKANSKNFALLEKGAYQLTSTVCGATYNSVKNLTDSILIVLGSPQK